MSAAKRLPPGDPRWDLPRADGREAGAAARARGVGLYDPGPVRAYREADLRRPLLNAITNVQSNPTGTKNFGALTSANGSWSVTTTAGNYLVCVLGTGISGVPGTITPPSPWVQRGTTHASAGNAANVAVFECLNASAQTTAAQSWSWANPVDGCVIIYAEYSGVATSSVTDGTDAFNAATSTTVTGGAVTTSNAADLLLGAAANLRTVASTAITFTQSGSWVVRASNNQRDTTNAWSLCVGLLEQVVAATGTYTATVTSSANLPFVAGTLASKAAGGAAVLPPPARFFYQPESFDPDHPMYRE